ncbi:asparagine synthase-related protein [Geotalea uraniireducens]|uniref:asparagine synthase (glutamine-hydrolyzing) n=1 Tax=Geotalea uraniireducens (strain Rf4) TaxID=351605 RepID=A5GA39_GEOUR|nr:asparagine synthase-related protein [Geotalea uraniireducens]ABQ25547.1 asparagine synthase [Geotalea uraniireducens Rf4]
MSCIFGFLRRDGASIAPLTMETMRRHMAEWGPDGGDVLLDGPAAMGQMRLFSTPEATYEKMPLIDAAEGFIFTAAGRVDNRQELIADCGLRIAEYEKCGIPDGEVILQAYRKWGEDCPKRIYGDWSFAVWHPRERRLFLARDHYGNTSLYYYADRHVFAFASDRKALLALDLVPKEMDELYLAQVLVSWPAYHGERTIHTPVKRLPPAHCLTVSHERLDVRRYWRLEETPELRLPRRNDYVEAFRDLFDEAVRCRLRVANGGNTQGNGAGQIAVTLSGGLDSGSVTATAAHFLRNEGRRLTAFTSVPLSDTSAYVKKNFGDEFPFARSTAQFAGNVDHLPITAAAITPIQAIRRMLRIHGEPAHAAGNFFWMLELEETARACGCRALLTGQVGNGGISWTGDVFSQPLALQLRHYGWRKWTKESAKRIASPVLLKAYRRARMPKDYSWCQSSAIHPDFARRLNLLEQRLNDPAEHPRSPQEKRFQILQPGCSFVGALHAQMGAAHGLEIRDPTADARVLAFTLSVPDYIFMDPTTGLDRWLIREAMKGRLPDEVRLNRERGRQAGDLVPRLRACADEVETALDELAVGPAAAYLNVPYMREVWAMVRTDDTPEAFRKSVTILTRGIMAGLWVNGFYNVT